MVGNGGQGLKGGGGGVVAVAVVLALALVGGVHE